MTAKVITVLLALSAALLASGCSPAPQAAPVYTLVPAEEEEKPPAAPAPVVVPKYYEVSAGDTLIGIALHYDLDYNEVARWNNLRDPNLIQPGQRLRLTPPQGDPIVQAVPKQQAVKLQPVDKTAAAPAGEPAAPTSAVQKQSTIINEQAASPAPAPGTAPYKTEPQAIKYAYNPSLLTRLQDEWRQRPPRPKPSAAAPPRIAKPGATAAPQAVKPAVARAPALTASRSSHGIIWSPPSSGKVIGRFSNRNKGMDFGGQRGDPVYAVADGTVIYVGTGVKSYGRLVIVRHSNDYLSAYAHNESILVKEDQQVKRGSEIATMGDSGSDRVMLHFEVRKGGKPFDPAQVLPK